MGRRVRDQDLELQECRPDAGIAADHHGDRGAVGADVLLEDRQRIGRRRGRACRHPDGTEDLDALALGKPTAEVRCVRGGRRRFDRVDERQIREETVEPTDIRALDPGPGEQTFGVAAEFGNQGGIAGQQRCRGSPDMSPTVIYAVPWCQYFRGPGAQVVVTASPDSQVPTKGIRS